MAVSEIRAAGPGDVEALARLRYEFRAAFETPNEPEEAFVARCGAWMRARLEADPPAWRAWVARAGDEGIVGNIWVQAIEKVPNPVAEAEAHAYVTNLYVKPDRRGEGVGARLLSTALEWCRAHEVHAVILWPTPGSRSLYARHGFAPPGDIMTLARGSGLASSVSSRPDPRG